MSTLNEIQNLEKKEEAVTKVIDNEEHYEDNKFTDEKDIEIKKNEDFKDINIYSNIKNDFFEKFKDKDKDKDIESEIIEEKISQNSKNYRPLNLNGNKFDDNYNHYLTDQVILQIFYYIIY